MERNIKLAFKSKEAVSKFKKLRMTSSEERYEEVFDTLDPEFQEYLKGKDPTSWATCQIRARNYGISIKWEVTDWELLAPALFPM